MAGIIEEAEKPLNQNKWGTYEHETAESFNQRYKKLLIELQKLKS